MYNRALDAFTAVAESGSFTKAAEQLFISHTAVIKQVNGLETHLKVTLFRRSNHGVVLTKAGACLLKNAETLRRTSAEIVRAVQAADNAPKAVRVGTSLFYPCHAFMDLWALVAERCPRYTLEIVPIADDTKRFAGLNTAYDFLISPYNAKARSGEIRFLPVGQYRFCIALPRRHPLAAKRRLRFEDLHGERLMMMARGQSEMNDHVRDEMEAHHPEITILDIEAQYSMRTFNRCAAENAALLSLECWDNVHPELCTVPFETDCAVPYGIQTAKKPAAEVEDFIAALVAALETK